MTLDEWKAQRQAQMLQPQYNIRRAGEGEDDPKWDNMKKLDKKLDESAALKRDETKKVDGEGKKKQVLDIEFHFNDGRRGGLGRRGPAGGVGGGPKQNRRRPPRENQAGPVGENGSAPAPVGGDRPMGGAPRDRDRDGGNRDGGNDAGQRRPRRQRFQRGTNEGQHAPKVDDERDFPSLS